jgi:hypothetical protein
MLLSATAAYPQIKIAKAILLLAETVRGFEYLVDRD